jgi:hypothetical protein
MEEGKIATAWASLVRLKENLSIRMRVLPWVTLLLAWAGSDQFQLLGEPVVLHSAIERSGKWKKVR